MSRFSAIDLSQLPAPDVVETIDYETLLSAVVAQLVEDYPDIEDVVQLESEPVRKLLEIMVYQAVLLRARVNDAGRAVMLASATGADLDNLGALYGVERLTITEADDSVSPAVDAVMEADDAFRARIQLAPEAYTTAGSAGAYEFHARAADARVADVGISSPSPGSVQVTILADSGAGTPDSELLAVVQAVLSADDVRPLCDTVIVAGPDIVTYSVVAEIEVAPGPDAATVLAAARAAVESYVASVHAIGATVAVSGLYAALHQAGVTRATLSAPAADIVCGVTQAPWCASAAVTLAEGA